MSINVGRIRSYAPKQHPVAYTCILGGVLGVSFVILGLIWQCAYGQDGQRNGTIKCATLVAEELVLADDMGRPRAILRMEKHSDAVFPPPDRTQPTLTFLDANGQTRLVVGISPDTGGATATWRAANGMPGLVVEVNERGAVEVTSSSLEADAGDVSLSTHEGFSLMVNAGGSMLNVDLGKRGFDHLSLSRKTSGSINVLLRDGQEPRHFNVLPVVKTENGKDGKEAMKAGSPGGRSDGGS